MHFSLAETERLLIGIQNQLQRLQDSHDNHNHVEGMRAKLAEPRPLVERKNRDPTECAGSLHSATSTNAGQWRESTSAGKALREHAERMSALEKSVEQTSTLQEANVREISELQHAQHGLWTEIQSPLERRKGDLGPAAPVVSTLSVLAQPRLPTVLRPRGRDRIRLRHAQSPRREVITVANIHDVAADSCAAILQNREKPWTWERHVNHSTEGKYCSRCSFCRKYREV